MYQGKQLAKIHIGKKELAMNDGDYRAFLKGFTGKTSAKDMSESERTLIIREMTKRGAFKTPELTPKQKACVAKWYTLRRLGAVNSKDKSSLNKYSKKHFAKWNICDLTADEADKLFNMLESWICKAKIEQGIVKVTVETGR